MDQKDTYQVEDYDPADGWTRAAKDRFRDALFAMDLTREDVEAELAAAIRESRI